MLAVFKREFISYFKNPTGYVAIALYSFLAGYIFVNKFAEGSVNLSTEIISMRSYFLIIVPIITMGLFAEDKRRGTDIIYYTSPVSIFSVVLGKFLAAMSLFVIMFFNVFAHMFVTASYGGVVDVGTWGSVIVYFFLAALFVSIGVFASSITDTQIISAIVSFVILLSLTAIDRFASNISSSLASIFKSFGLSNERVNTICEKVEKGVNWLNPITKTSGFRSGIFSVAPLVFCFSTTLVFLFLTYRVLEKKRWAQ